MWQHWDWFCIGNNVSSSSGWAMLLPISVLENHNQRLFIGRSVFCRVSARRRTDPRSDVLKGKVGRWWGRWDQYCVQSWDQPTLWLFKTVKISLTDIYIYIFVQPALCSKQLADKKILKINTLRCELPACCAQLFLPLLWQWLSGERSWRSAIPPGAPLKWIFPQHLGRRKWQQDK